MEDPLLGKPARNRPVTHISLNLLSGMLLSMRVVPDGRDGNVVFGRTLRWGEADDGRGVTVARGEEFTIPKGRLVVQLDHIDSLSELGPGGLRAGGQYDLDLVPSRPAPRRGCVPGAPVAGAASGHGP